MKSLKGHFLVASRTLSDPNFICTVLLLVEHSEEGAAGVVLDRPTGATIAEISEKVFGEEEAWNKPIQLGGPVPGPLLAFHSVEGLADQRVIEGLYSTVDPDMLLELIRLRVEPSVFLVNYAGWGVDSLRWNWMRVPGSSCPPTRRSHWKPAMQPCKSTSSSAL